jgi:peptidoglycan/LPS O-acetylase OafA/YrhL
MRFAARAPSPARLDALTGIRPFASFAVFFFHFGRPLVAGAPAPLRAAASSGFVAVSFFYVLSGFVLTLGTRRQFADGSFTHGRFLARRIARVVPAAFLALALISPLALHAAWGQATGAFPVDGPNRWLTLLLHATFLEAWFPSLALTWNLPAWSVSVELAFYLVFPLIARFVLLRPPRVRLTVAALAWIASLGITLAYVLLDPDQRAIGPDSEARFINALKFWPPARLPEFVFGVALGALYSQTWRVPRWLGPLALGLIVAVPASRLVPYPILHNAALMPAFGALLIAVAAARGRIAHALSHPLLVHLGRSGYAIYILQMPLMYLVMLATSAGIIDWRGASFFFFFGTLCLATALVARRLVETPLQTRLETLLASTQRRSV